MMNLQHTSLLLKVATLLLLRLDCARSSNALRATSRQQQQQLTRHQQEQLESVNAKKAVLAPAVYVRYDELYLSTETEFRPNATDEKDLFMSSNETTYPLDGFDPDLFNDTTFSESDERHFRELSTRFRVTRAEVINARFVLYERQVRGLGGLSWAVDCQAQAKSWARHLAYFAPPLEHRNPLSIGIDPGWRLLCENLAGNDSIGWNGAHRALMNSAGHRMNILDPAINFIGVGIAADRHRSGYYYMVQVFKAA